MICLLRPLKAAPSIPLPSEISSIVGHGSSSRQHTDLPINDLAWRGVLDCRTYVKLVDKLRHVPGGYVALHDDRPSHIMACLASKSSNLARSDLSKRRKRTVVDALGFVVSPRRVYVTLGERIAATTFSSSDVQVRTVRHKRRLNRQSWKASQSGRLYHLQTSRSRRL